MSSNEQIGRRHFLKRSAAGVLGAGAAARAAWAARAPHSQVEDQSAPPQAKETSKVREYRTLGRTGFKVSDIGTGSVMDDGVLRAALEAGVNYIDTAEQYPGHHGLIAKALKGFDRSKVFIATKLEILEDRSKEGFLKRARKSLEELQTEYVDCLMMHMPEQAALLKTEGFHAAVAELRAEGRVKFVGVSNHGSFWFQDPAEPMEKVLLAAADDGRFDVFLMAYNFLRMDGSEKVLEVCREKNIGTAIMKSTPIAIYYSLKSRVEQLEQEKKEVHPLYAEGLKRYKDKLDRAEVFLKEHGLQNQAEIQDAAVRFVLANPNVSTVCCVPKTYDELERFVGLSGTKLSTLERGRLRDYREGCGDLYCRHACGLCEPSCPHGVPVNTIMRYDHYFGAQGREREAMGYYAAIPGVNAAVCAGCPGHCERACPFGVPIQGKLLLAHAQLTLP